MISLQEVYFRYSFGDFTMSVDQLHVDRSEKVGVVGPSGSGKTTLLNLIAGILLPEKGQVNVSNIAINTMTDKSRRDYRIKNIGFIFQDFGLLDYLNIQDNILHPYRITGVLSLTVEVREKAVELARQMGIAEKLLRHPSDLSQGERQRAAICRLLHLLGLIGVLAEERGK